MNVYLIGDSTSVGPYSFGGHLAADLRSLGHYVTVDAKGSRSSWSYAKEGGLVTIDAVKSKYHWFIVALGTNCVANVSVGGSLEYHVDSMIRLIRRIGPEKVVFLGSVNYHPKSKYPMGYRIAVEFNNAIGRTGCVVAPMLEWSGRYNEPSVYTDPAGIHPVGKGAKAMAHEAVTYLTGFPPPTHKGGDIERVYQWLPIVNRYIGGFDNLDVAFVLSTIEHESRGFVGARSNVGAISLMQLMPPTAAWVIPGLDPWVPENNIFGGMKLLDKLVDDFVKHKRVIDRRSLIGYAAASYYAGYGRIEKYYPAIPSGAKKSWAPQGEIAKYVQVAYVLYDEWARRLGYY